jgi:hypothetical protein
MNIEKLLKQKAAIEAQILAAENAHRNAETFKKVAAKLMQRHEGIYIGNPLDFEADLNHFLIEFAKKSKDKTQ